MSAATATPPRISVPVMLIGLLVFACGLVVQEPLLSYLGLTVFLATHMLTARPAREDRHALSNAAILRDQARAQWHAQRHAAHPDGPHPGIRPTQPPKTTAPARTARDARVRAKRATIRNAPEMPAADPTVPALHLCPVLPLPAGAETRSWIGGHPCLPDGTDWPTSGGKPALFLAQIDCAALPPGLWGGKGPRDGWLVVFRAPSPGGVPLLLHTSRLGQERKPPEALRYPGSIPIREDILEKVTGQPSAPPRWPIALRAQPHSGKTPRPGRHARASASQQTPALDDPQVRPFDWTSAMILIEVILSDLDWQHTVIAALADPGSDDTQALGFTDTLAAVLDSVRALKSELAAAKQGGLPFDDALRGLVLRGLAQLQVPNGDPSEGTGTQSLLDHGQIRHDYLRWLDLYARQLYCKTPDALPAAPRARFEEIWASHARHPHGWLGQATHPRDNATPFPTLRLQNSRLLGWNFGEGEALDIALDTDALAQGMVSVAPAGPRG